MNYDIDWISVRAAWLLDEITFQDFGYQSRSSIMGTKENTPPKQLALYRLMLADSVSKWWEKNKDIWTRYSALKEALSSTNGQRQRLALSYLLSDNTICDGLTIENYKVEVMPLLQKIKQSKNSESEQAQNLIEDTEYYYFKAKRKKSNR